MANSSKSYQATRVPASFTVSVTGHRNTGQRRDLENRLEEILDQIGTTCRALDTNVNLRLNTALAAGAGQLAGRALLSANRKNQDYRWALQVVLPFERESYYESLPIGLSDTDSTIAKSFDKLLQQADSVFELADLKVIPPTPDPDINSERQRYWQSQRYRTLGKILARQADVLLVIWNGRHSDTADMVAIALAHGKPVIQIDPDTLKVSFLRPSHLHADHIRLARKPTWGPCGDISKLFEWRDNSEVSEQEGNSKPIVKKEVFFLTLAMEAICTPAWNAVIHHPANLFSSAEAFLGTPNREKLINENSTSLFHKAANILLRRSKTSFPERAASTTRWRAYQYLLNVILGLFEPAKIKKIPIETQTGLEEVKGLRVNYAEDDWSLPPYSPDASEDIRERDSSDYYQRDTARPAQLDNADHELRVPMVSADTIATARAHAYRSSYVINFLAGALAVWVGLLGLLSKSKVVFVATELLVLLLLVALYYIASRGCWHERWLNTRSITETLRAGRYLIWLGMGGRRALHQHAPWVAWYSNAVMASVPGPNATLEQAGLRRIARELQSHVIHQINYHKGNASKLKRMHRGLEVLGSYCLLGAIIAALLYVAGSALLGESHNLVSGSKYFVTVYCAGLPILASALMGIRFQGDFERFAERSEETEQQLHKINDRLEAMIIRDVEPAHQPLFEELSQIVVDITETYGRDLEDWYYVYAARPATEPG